MGDQRQFVVEDDDGILTLFVHDGEKPGRAGVGRTDTQEPGDRLPLVDPLDVDRVVEVLVRVRPDRKGPSRSLRPLRGSATTVVPASRSCTHVRWQGEQRSRRVLGGRSRQRHRRQPVRRRAPAHGPLPYSTGSGRRLNGSKPQADERLPEGRSLEDRGKDLVRGNGDDDEEQRPALGHVDLRGCGRRDRHREVADRVPRARTRAPTST